MLCKNNLGQAIGIYPSPAWGAALFSALRTPTATCFSLYCTVDVQPKSLSLDPLRGGAGMAGQGFPWLVVPLQATSSSVPAVCSPLSQRAPAVIPSAYFILKQLLESCVVLHL